jgi:hypothetical protein
VVPLEEAPERKEHPEPPHVVQRARIRRARRVREERRELRRVPLHFAPHVQRRVEERRQLRIRKPDALRGDVLDLPRVQQREREEVPLQKHRERVGIETRADMSESQKSHRRGRFS